MTTSKLLELAAAAGFSQEMADFLLEHFSLKPHTHTADQILDFDESVTQIVEDTGFVGDEDEDEIG